MIRTRAGVYAEVAGKGGSYAGYFNGDVQVNGSLTWTSDATLKTNVQALNSDSALALLSRLQPKTYQFDTTVYPFLSLPRGNQYGLLAQDVEQVLPDLVSNITQPERRDVNGNVLSAQTQYKGLNYIGLIPLLISAVKEQKQKIDSLENVIDSRLTALEQHVAQCCASSTGGSFKTDAVDSANDGANHVSVELSGLQVIVLEQNAPNPFAEQTSISYFVPDDVSSAQMTFTDMNGQVIKTVEVQKGYGVVTVFAPNLSSGTYSYTLIVNGNPVETKRMVKQK